MSQRIEASDKLAHDSQHPPEVSNGKVKIQGPLKGVVVPTGLLVWQWLGRANQRHSGPAEQALIFSNGPTLGTQRTVAVCCLFTTIIHSIPRLITTHTYCSLIIQLLHIPYNNLARPIRAGIFLAKDEKDTTKPHSFPLSLLVPPHPPTIRLVGRLDKFNGQTGYFV